MLLSGKQEMSQTRSRVTAYVGEGACKRQRAAPLRFSSAQRLILLRTRVPPPIYRDGTAPWQVFCCRRKARPEAPRLPVRRRECW